MKPLGMLFYAIGAILLLVVLVWGRSGVYQSQMVVFVTLCAVGIVAVIVGARLNKDKNPNKAVDWKPSEALQSAGEMAATPDSADDAGAMMNCPNCGTLTRVGAGYCGNCGAKLEVTPSASSPTLAPPPPPPAQTSPPPSTQATSSPPPPPPPPPPLSSTSATPLAAAPEPVDPVDEPVVLAEEPAPANPNMISLPPGLVSSTPATDAPAPSAPAIPSMAEAVFITSPGVPPAPPPTEDLDATRVSTKRRTGSPWRLVLPDGQHYVVEGTVLIGRDPASRVKWPDAKLLSLNDTTKSVSKTHAVIEADVEGLWVTDLKSTNGVVVTTPDGRELDGDGGERLRVEPGSDIELGDYVIQVEKD